MAFNKAKTLEAAQKYLAAGKIPQAIAEYQQVLRAEPEDQVTLMTVGDLYVRVGDITQSLVFFEKLAQIFNNDGFISKSIAIYKKIAKIAPNEIMPLERLAELYVQQGVMSEARPIFLQLAEAHLKANRTQPAIEVLRKLLELAPDNLRVQQRLADLYLAIGQEKEASAAFVTTAQRLLEKGDSAEALKMAEKALQATAKNPAAVAMKARCLAASNRTKDAMELLSKLPPSMVGPETTTLLTELYLQNGQTEGAIELARNAFKEGPAKYALVFGVVGGLLEGGETDRGLSLLGEIRDGVMKAGESERLVSALQVAVDRMPGKLEPVEWLADVYRASGDPFHLPEALNQLADAAMFVGDTQKAKAALEELVSKDPENEGYKARLRDFYARTGQSAPAAVEASLENVAPFEVEAPAPEVSAAPVETKIDEDTERYINQALTDVDLFTSYGLNQKGIDLLENVLKRAPGHAQTLEKLLDLYLGAGNEKRTSELAGQLEEHYSGKNDAANAEKFGELRRRFQRAAARTEEAAGAAPPAAEFPVPFEVTPSESPTVDAVEEVAVVEAEPAASETHEVDLSAEWAAMTGEAASQPAPVEAPAAAEDGFAEIPLEIEVSSDEAAVEEPAAAAPAVPEDQPAPPAEETVAYDFSADTVVEEPAPAPVAAMPPPAEIPVEAVPSEADAAQMFGEVAAEIEVPAESKEEPVSVASAKPAAAPPPPPAQPPPPQVEEEPTIEYEFETSQAAEEPPAAQPVAAAPMSSSQFLSELGDELGDFEIAPMKEEPKAAEKPAKKKKEEAKPAKAAAPKASDQLREVFDEFRADMGEATEAEEEGEDIETHYNLGIAYREMGLAEEAIGEFQKVAKAVQSGRPFKYAMQCYTLLGLTFMDKGQPKISAIWYEKALKTPDLDPESVMAVRYDLGVAQELAGDHKAALDSFSQVYAMNIDYRDVGERITELHKKV